MSKDAIVGGWQDLVRQASTSEPTGESSETPAHPFATKNGVFPVGARTKSRLAAVDCPTTIEVKELSGIVTYDPSEYLITASAGTTVAELNEALSEHGQHLPFDPLYVREGATIGGTVASGISGPGQLLFGSLRDFVMEVEFIDGLGNLVRGGGKVVKNAAGFDFPKLMVGSLGRLGILTEVTLKVLPAPRSTLALSAHFPSTKEALSACSTLSSESLPIRMLNIDPNGCLQVQVAGLEDALPHVVSRIRQLLPSDWETHPPAPMKPSALDSQIGDSPIVVRVATQASALLNLLDSVRALHDAAYEIHAGGSLLWLGISEAGPLEELGQVLERHSASGMVVSGPAELPSFLGDCGWQNLATRIQNSIDPKAVFSRFRVPTTSDAP